LLLMFCLIGAIGALIGRNQFNACHMRGHFLFSQYVIFALEISLLLLWKT